MRAKQGADGESDTMDEKTTDGGLDTDTFHEILSNPRRRAAIKYLDEYGSLEKGELATLVAADEVGKEPDELESNERSRVVVSLTQQHLDKLKDGGVVDIERDSVVHQGPHFPEMVRGLEPNTESVNITLENADVVIKDATVHIRGEEKE